MITRRNFVVLAGIGAMGLLNTAGCAAPAEEPPRDVSGEQEPLEVPSPIPQKEPVASSEPFSGEIIPGCCALRSTRQTLLRLSTRGLEKWLAVFPSAAIRLRFLPWEIPFSWGAPALVR